MRVFFFSYYHIVGIKRVVDVQRLCLQKIHKLISLYAYVWQAIENPPRSFDSERSLVASCMFAIFDACVRTKCCDSEPLLLSEMLEDEGGYALSTSVCQNNRDVIPPLFDLSNKSLQSVSHFINAEIAWVRFATLRPGT